MKLSEQLVLAFLCAVQTFSLNCEIVQLCDVEGSGVEDCSINEFCCKQSECDKAYNNGSGIDNVIDIEYDYDADYDQKCCNESEEIKDQGQETMSSQWVIKKKEKADGQKMDYKGGMVARGFQE